MRESTQVRSFEDRQGDHPVDEYLRSPDQQQCPAAHQRGERRGSDDDPAGCEQRLDGLGRGRTEQLERLLLGRYQRDLDVAGTVLVQVTRGHERELVQRQRPHSLRGKRERHRLGLAGDQVVQQTAQDRYVTTAAEGEGPGKRRPGHRTGSDHEDVERNPSPVVGHGDPAADFDVGQHAVHELSASLLREDLGQVVHARFPAVERFGDGHRTVDELPLTRQQGDVDKTTGEFSQRQ